MDTLYLAKEQLSELYKEFLKTCPCFGIMVDDKYLEYFEKDKDKLNIEVSDFQMKQWFQQYGIIVLREWKNEEILIIGCGNNHDLYYKYDDYDHLHINCYTVNPDAHNNNPSTIGSFGNNIFGNLPNNIFKEIRFEGLYIDKEPFDIIETNEEMREQGYYGEFEKAGSYHCIPECVRLLKDGGIITQHNNTERKEAKTYFVKHNNTLVSIDNTITLTKESSYDNFFDYMWSDFK